MLFLSIFKKEDFYKENTISPILFLHVSLPVGVELQEEESAIVKLRRHCPGRDIMCLFRP